MPLDIRTYHDLTEPDRSGLAEQIGVQRRRLAQRMQSVGRVVAVMSGKGGVGKSFVTAFVARAIARGGRTAGVLDADLNGPTQARLLWREAGDGPRPPLTIREGAVIPAVGIDGVRFVSTDLLLADGQPLAFRGPDADRFVWRGAMEAAALRELLADVAWGTTDVLLIDLPPGLGRFEELSDLLGAPPAVLTVTIPTIESRDAVRRALRAAAARGAQLLGIIENMSGGTFEGTAGEDLAREFGLELLARVPWQPSQEIWDTLGSRL
ncbi:MAG TPA: P-loop NTPase [Gemmatimonadales bacterium]|nr:P-loop NTPase [Gemmatimonadales bacterium]